MVEVHVYKSYAFVKLEIFLNTSILDTASLASKNISIIYSKLMMVGSLVSTAEKSLIFFELSSGHIIGKLVHCAANSICVA